MEKLHMKFSALNIDFDGPSLDFLNLRTRASKSGIPVEVLILPLLASFSWKRLQITVGMLPITTSTNDELFSHVKIDEFERPWTCKISGFIDVLWSSVATKWLEINWQFVNSNCYRLSHVSWALAQIACFVLLSKICTWFLLWKFVVLTWV